MVEFLGLSCLGLLSETWWLLTDVMTCRTHQRSPGSYAGQRTTCACLRGAPGAPPGRPPPLRAGVGLGWGGGGPGGRCRHRRLPPQLTTSWTPRARGAAVARLRGRTRPGASPLGWPPGRALLGWRHAPVTHALVRSCPPGGGGRLISWLVGWPHGWRRAPWLVLTGSWW